MKYLINSEKAITDPLDKSKRRHLFPFLVFIIFIAVLLFCISLMIPNIEFKIAQDPTPTEANQTMFLAQSFFTGLAGLAIFMITVTKRNSYCIGRKYSAKEMQEMAREIQLSPYDSTPQTEELISRLKTSTLRVKDQKMLKRLLKSTRQSY
ncbi:MULTISPECIES: hypothetical protein [unclassified Fusibacter]|uniref:hypothetical protein n=1 Tax=unclassified Fusibacter TaxID=2624464 RepID=UPI001010A25E|nr:MULTISPECIES: hypothetical protein [unclassified Fusibacter]MCK8059318.1 hypothetical protein [Fusibacter sp. A2]NPE21218.1 hypothetical protein [Fusibacter sp. A1]RXV62486.1 hypothetical protein DWB64_05230 [Fusibacter sp. A1]